MMKFILTFFGLRISGFKRHNVFIAAFSRFRYSQYMRDSVAYFVGFCLAGVLAICSLNNASFVNQFHSVFSKPLSLVKLFANDLIEFPVTISEYMSQNNNLKEEIHRLKLENDNLKISLTDIKNLEIEFNDIKKSIDLKYSLSNYGVIEKVLGFDKSVYESFIIISVTHDKIYPGCVVLSSDGVIGIVHDVEGNIARVRHICDQKFNIPVSSESGEHLILAGNGYGKMISREIMETPDRVTINLKKNNKLVTSGEGGVFQYGIPVAIVDDVSKDAVNATPVSSPYDTSFVWIIEPILKRQSH